MTEIQKELDRWHNFSDGTIGNKYALSDDVLEAIEDALMTLFIATVAPEFKEEVQCNIEDELERVKKK